MDDESMALVATFAFEQEADLARGLLESAGIPAFLRNETVNRLNSLVYPMSEGGWQLYVPASAEQDARDLLNSRVSAGDLASQAE
jgi:putative signal transducing protein